MLFYLLKKASCDPKKLLSSILFRIDSYCRRIISQASHFKCTEGGGWEPTTRETFLLELNNATARFGWSFYIILGNPHERNILFVDFILNGQVVEQGAEVVKGLQNFVNFSALIPGFLKSFFDVFDFFAETLVLEQLLGLIVQNKTIGFLNFRIELADLMTHLFFKFI